MTNDIFDLDSFVAVGPEVKKKEAFSDYNNDEFTLERIDAVVVQAPVDGLDGKDGLDGAKGADGIGLDGAKGADGLDGSSGSDGVSVVDTFIQGDNLFIRLSDGKLVNAGNVRGPQGLQGHQGSGGGRFHGGGGSPKSQVFLNPTFSYTDGVLTGVAYSNGPTKDLGYNLDGSLDTLATIINGTTTTKTFNYNEDGTLASIT